MDHPGHPPVTIAERAALRRFSHVDADPHAAALIAALDERASLPAIQRLRATATAACGTCRATQPVPRRRKTNELLRRHP